MRVRLYAAFFLLSAVVSAQTAGTSATQTTSWSLRAGVSETTPLLHLYDSAGIELLRVQAHKAAASDGNNTFVGRDSGNLTMGPSGGAVFLGSYNSAFGTTTLNANTTGHYNTAQGVNALAFNTTGAYNSAQGSNALYSNTEGNRNAALGEASLYFNTTGSDNTAVGTGAGRTETPANANVTGTQNVWIGVDSGPSGVAQLTNSIGIGYRSHPAASNQAVLGNASITSTLLYGLIALSGTTSAFPALKRVDEGVEIRLADDSASAPLSSGVGGSVPAWAKYALLKIANGVNGCASANGCWQVNGVLGAAAAANLTQDIVLFQLPARGFVDGERIKSNVACTGPASVAAGLGVAGTVGFFRTRDYDVQAAVSNTNLTNELTNPGSTTAAAINVEANLVTTINNVDQIADGCAIDYWVKWAVLP